jgi:O-antigen ligase
MRSSLKSRYTTVIGVICGIGLGSALGLAGSAQTKYAAALLLGVFFILALAVFRSAERLCLIALMFTIPFPMHAFLLKLDPMHGGGALGIYLMAADLPLIVLYLCWFFDWRRGASEPQRRSNKYIYLLIPFLLVSGLSVAWSAQPLWAVCEWLRWFKVFLILLYAVKRLRREDIPICAWAMAGSASLESLLAVLQSVKHSNLGLDKLGVFGAGGAQAVTQDLQTGGSLFRGSALTGHPNFLASYLLLSLPMLALIALVEKSPWKKALWYGAFLLSLAGLVSTMSRAAWVSFLIAATLAFFVSIGLSLMPIKRAAILLLAGLAIAGVAGLSMADLIRERFRADWNESWKLRVELNEAAIDIAHDHLIGGVGLNNFTVYFPQYDPHMADTMMQIDDMLTVVHNVYLLVWVEVGTVGFAAYALFFLGVFWLGGKSLNGMTMQNRALALGILAGVLGAMMFDLTEISLWLEIMMYSLAFWIGALEPLATSQPARIFVRSRPRLQASNLRRAPRALGRI